MLVAQNIFYKLSILFVLIFALIFCFTYLQKGLGQRDRHVFLLNSPFLIALDHETFENADQFSRASLLTTDTITMRTTTRQFSRGVAALTTGPTSEVVYIVKENTLIEISSAEDHRYDLKPDIKNPVIALGHHSVESKIYALTDSHDLYEIQIKNKTFNIRSLGKISNMPQDMAVQEMWINPQTAHLVLALSKEDDSILMTIDPKNLSATLKTLALPGLAIKAGFSVSKDLLVVLDHKYRLHVIDWEREMVLGNYYPNQYFQDSQLFSHAPIGFGFSKDYCYLLDETGGLHQLSWKANPQAILIDRDVKIAKGKVILQWKSPAPNSNTLYLAQLAVTPQRTITQTKRIIPPTQNQQLEIPLNDIEMASKIFDLSLMSIHKDTGKILSPSVQFTLEKGDEN